jgi:hypothetical protein
MRERLEETTTLTIPTQLVQKHAEKIFLGNGISITNFNILPKMSPNDCFPNDYLPIPYLATFSIVGFRIGGLNTALPLLRDLQKTPRVPRYTN